MFMFDYLLILVGVFLSIAFFTLVERKLLGFIHFRKGPSKVLYFGVLQPIADALKLFSKEFLKGYKMTFYLYLMGPLIGLFLMCVLWCVCGGYFGCFGSFYSLIFVMSFFSCGVYFLFFCGWGSNSKYAVTGSYRGIAQTVSYEISMFFLVLFPVFFLGVYDLSYFFFFQVNYWFFIFSFFLTFSWAFVVFSESMRSPFDFSEGESELVSGFNVEYPGGWFSLIFLCEYGMVIFLSYITVFIFLGSSSFLFKGGIICFFFVWVRGCFPRYRYDLLMSMAWKEVLPFSIFFLLLALSASF